MRSSVSRPPNVKFSCAALNKARSAAEGLPKLRGVCCNASYTARGLAGRAKYADCIVATKYRASTDESRAFEHVEERPPDERLVVHAVLDVHQLNCCNSLIAGLGHPRRAIQELHTEILTSRTHAKMRPIGYGTLAAKVHRRRAPLSLEGSHRMWTSANSAICVGGVTCIGQAWITG